MHFKHESSIAFTYLRDKIRHGTEPDNPLIIKLWLDHYDQDYLSIEKSRERLTHQFNLLLETVLDDLVPVHWRRTCLDNIYIPLSSLKKLANDPSSEQHIQSLFTELAVSTRYVEKSLILS